ncbi:hypothetical protein QE152_g32173 [Popillia japonica]|uniref:Uncharacterized protein n=1 Tax=Popillia japonica TaxID=7064 RepID=A0AAW1IZY8_POPJA
MHSDYKFPPIEKGMTVTIPVPDVDRSIGDLRNLIGISFIYLCKLYLFPLVQVHSRLTKSQLLDSANGNSPQSGSHLSNLESTKNVETVSRDVTDGDGDFSPDESVYVPEDSDSSSSSCRDNSARREFCGMQEDPIDTVKPRRTKRQPSTATIPECQRLSIFKTYYELTNYTPQRNFITANTQKFQKKTRTVTGEESRRNFSIRYFFPVDGTKRRVCKPMFLNTLGIKKVVVDITMKKLLQHNIATCDGRGKGKRTLDPQIVEDIKMHVPSHCVRADTSRKYLDSFVNLPTMYRMYEQWYQENSRSKGKLSAYRNIFNNNFNLGFYKPRKDQCRVCVAFENEKNATEQMKNNYEIHLNCKEEAREAKRNDKEYAFENNYEIHLNCKEEAREAKRNDKEYAFENDVIISYFVFITIYSNLVIEMSDSKKRRVEESKDPNVLLRWFDEMASEEDSPLDNEEEDEIEQDIVQKSDHETNSELEFTSDEDESIFKTNGEQVHATEFYIGKDKTTRWKKIAVNKLYFVEFLRRRISFCC